MGKFTSSSLTNKLISAHSGGINVSFCDGHQYYLNSNMDIAIFKLIMTPWGDGIPRKATLGADNLTTPTLSYPWKNSTKSDAVISGIPATGTLFDEGSL